MDQAMYFSDDEDINDPLVDISRTEPEENSCMRYFQNDAVDA